MTPTMTKKTSLNSRFPTTKNSLLRGVVASATTVVVLIVASGLSPLSAGDRPALALIAVTLSVLVGGFAARPTKSLRDASNVALAGVLSGLVLSLVVVFEPSLWIRTASWCVAGALAAACVGSWFRGAWFVVLGGWVFLNGLPFFYEYLGRETWQDIALTWSPWLGFSQDAFSLDPLRRSILYMGHWSDLTTLPPANLFSASNLWWLSMGGLTVLFAVAMFRQRRKNAIPDPEPGVAEASVPTA